MGHIVTKYIAKLIPALKTITFIARFTVSVLFPTHTAETSMAEDYHLDQSDAKRYSVDPGDSAFSSISSSYTPKPSYGFRSSQQFSNGSAPMGMCRQTSSSPNTFLESNRTGEWFTRSSGSQNGVQGGTSGGSRVPQLNK